MEQLNKLKDTIKQLDGAIAKAQAATTSAMVNAADAEIGACLRSIQYGVGMVGIECKHMVENRQKELRGLSLVPPAPTTPEEPVVESKTIKRKKRIARRSKKSDK